MISYRSNSNLTTPSCPFSAAYEGCIRLYKVSGLLGLISGSGCNFTTYSLPFGTVHESGVRPYGTADSALESVCCKGISTTSLRPPTAARASAVLPILSAASIRIEREALAQVGYTRDLLFSYVLSLVARGVSRKVDCQRGRRAGIIPRHTRN